MVDDRFPVDSMTFLMILGSPISFTFYSSWLTVSIMKIVQREKEIKTHVRKSFFVHTSTFRNSKFLTFIGPIAIPPPNKKSSHTIRVFSSVFLWINSRQSFILTEGKSFASFNNFKIFSRSMPYVSMSQECCGILIFQIFTEKSSRRIHEVADSWIDCFRHAVIHEWKFANAWICRFMHWQFSLTP